jgi:hypothetical protein
VPVFQLTVKYVGTTCKDEHVRAAPARAGALSARARGDNQGQIVTSETAPGLRVGSDVRRPPSRSVATGKPARDAGPPSPSPPKAQPPSALFCASVASSDCDGGFEFCSS